MYILIRIYILKWPKWAWFWRLLESLSFAACMQILCFNNKFSGMQAAHILCQLPCHAPGQKKGRKEPQQLCYSSLGHPTPTPTSSFHFGLRDFALSLFYGFTFVLDSVCTCARLRALMCVCVQLASKLLIF